MYAKDRTSDLSVDLAGKMAAEVVNKRGRPKGNTEPLRRYRHFATEESAAANNRAKLEELRLREQKDELAHDLKLRLLKLTPTKSDKNEKEVIKNLIRTIKNDNLELRQLLAIRSRYI